MALSFHERCLHGAQESADKGLIGSAHYHLGQCLESLQEATQAIEHYNAYLDLCKEQDDHDGQGAAAFALASAYQQTGDTASAVTHLEAFIELAQGTGQVRSQAEACNSLGVIHSKQGDARSAVHYFERFYELARSLGDRRLTDKVRADARTLFRISSCVALRAKCFASQPQPTDCICCAGACQPRDSARKLGHGCVRAGCDV